MATAKKAPAAPKTAAKAPKAPKAPAAPKPERVKQPESNGVSRPKDGTSTGRIWEIADSLSSKGNPAGRAAVLEAAVAEGINESTVATQYQRWRQFNGLPGRAPAAPKAPKAPKKAAKKAEAAEA